MPGMLGDEQFPSRSFLLYWRANAVSAFGTKITLLHLQTLVILNLHGSSADVGWLSWSHPTNSKRGPTPHFDPSTERSWLSSHRSRGCWPMRGQSGPHSFSRPRSSHWRLSDLPHRLSAMRARLPEHHTSSHRHESVAYRRIGRWRSARRGCWRLDPVSSYCPDWVSSGQFQWVTVGTVRAAESRTVERESAWFWPDRWSSATSRMLPEVAGSNPAPATKDRP